MEEGFGSQFERLIVRHQGGDRSLNGSVWMAGAPHISADQKAKSSS